MLGEFVRYDGRLKRADDLIEDLRGRVRWISICPEVGSGLSAPRPAMDLFQTQTGVRMLTLDKGHDHTDAMRDFGRRAVAHLIEQGACGVIFKSRSPSCGIGDAKLHDGTTETTDGLMVRAVREALSDLPMARDEDLLTPTARDAFIAQAHRYSQELSS